MDMGRKFCARCNRGIYTTWRTLDEKKYYHPQCFTCADCGMILESINDYGVATASSDEIYCGRCQIERFGACRMANNEKIRSKDTLRDCQVVNLALKTKLASRSPMDLQDRRKHNDYYGMQTETATVMHGSSAASSRNGLHKLANKENNVNVLFSSPSPFVLLGEGDESSMLSADQPVNGAIGNTKKKVKLRNKEQSETKVLQKKRSMIPSPMPEEQLPSTHTELVQMGSRIPRPTSAHSKKSLTGTAFPVKVKVNRSQTENAKNLSLRPPLSPASNHAAAVTPRMQRSISLHQARNKGVNQSREFSSSFSAHTKSTRSSSQSTPRPRSALSASTREPKSVTEYTQTADNNVGVKTSSSKRQCAASFSTKRKKGSKTKQQISKDAVDHSVHISNDAYPQLKGGIPSTQAILTAIRREGSDILKLKSSSGIQITSSESYDIPHPQMDRNINTPSPALPTRSFNMTFECPICISSLVPGSYSNETGCQDGKSQCPNVVTPCGHLFHGKCMDNWLKIKGNKRCPICSTLCLPETLQPVFLECNLCADLNPTAMYTPTDSSLNGIGKGRDEITNASFRTLRSEYELLKAKYNAVLAENHNYAFNATLANSLQNAYDMECRNRLQLQWENRKLLMKIEELKNAAQDKSEIYMNDLRDDVS